MEDIKPKKDVVASAAGGGFVYYSHSPSPSGSGGSFDEEDDEESSVIDESVNESTEFVAEKDVKFQPALDASSINELLDDLIGEIDDKNNAEEQSSILETTKNADELQIIQTREDLNSKAESARAKRFEYLLEQTELWGHFMRPAYQEALSMAVEANSGSKESSENVQAGPSPKVEPEEENSKIRSSQRKRKVPLHLSPDISVLSGVKSGSSRTNQEASKYVTHFDVSPNFIAGGSMRDYQVRGLNWMISLHERGLNGILADEMGLGKTIQAISLMGYLKHFRNINGPHLIIAPKSTLPNWMNEINRWCPTLKAICLIGTKEERKEFIKKSFLPKRWNVCVTSYEIAKIEKLALSKINYCYVVIDEAQKIKNENSVLSNRVRLFRSTGRLLLTGTPLQNNLHELWALLNFLLPDVFSSSEDFDSWFNETNCMGNQSLVDRLHAVLRPFMLRRIKSDVEKSLPPKTEMRLYVQMTPMQREWYRKTLLNDIQVITSTGEQRKKILQNVIMHLRKVCNHPYLFEGAEPQPFTTDSHLIFNSGKMIVLDKLLLKLKSQQSRVLLFSQMTRMLDILEDYCILRGFDYCRLDGETSYDIRQEDIDAFNAPDSSKFIYLLSTRAGGLGINLASANIVIIYDSDWNPQMDLQAMDRAHRIGQTKQVKVFRFVVQDTAEEKIVERAAAKMHLDKMVIQQGRLVGASAAKGATSVEMMNIVRFGAEKILKAGKNEGITDTDIDTILAQSKIRSDELDRRLNGINEDNLKELTIEQVELKWEQSMDVIDTFNFEGKNYRELRKRKIVLNHDDTSTLKMEGKRRKDSGLLAMPYDTNRKSKIYDTDTDSDFLLSEDDEKVLTVDGQAHLNLVKSGKNTKKHAPRSPYGFQFCPPYIWELHFRKLDVYRKDLESYKCCDHFPDDLPLQDLQTLTSFEKNRLQNCEELNAFEFREILMLKKEGFSSWNNKHFSKFIQTMKVNGHENLEAIAATIPEQQPEDVVKYSQVFWLRCHELINFEKLMGKLNRTDMIEMRRAYQQKLLDTKFENVKDIFTLEIFYDPHHWKGQRFSTKDDIQLLYHISKIGMQTPDVFKVLLSALLESSDKLCSSFLRSRTVEELHARFNLLMYMIEKETRKPDK